MTAQLFNDTGKGGSLKPKCHTKHPILKLGNGGEILGASCGHPREGFDIYIGFCYTMKFQHQPYPWETENDPIQEFPFHITDMCAPKSPKKFKAMIEWVADQLDEGKRIHVGCIGGHGRTGTFLAALVSKYEDLTDDPIKWVRENHCQKAVESKAQVKFLMKHFGCKTAKPTKADWPSHTGTHTGRLSGKKANSGNIIDMPRGQRITGNERLKHLAGKGSIWG